MSDYLTSVVARNLEVAPRLEPRLASTFEPPPRHGGGIGPRVDVSPLDGADSDEEIERAPARSATSPHRAAGESGVAEHPRTRNAALPSQAAVQPLQAGQPRDSLPPTTPSATARTPQPTEIAIAARSRPRIVQDPIAPLGHDDRAGDALPSNPRPPAAGPRHSHPHTTDRAKDAEVPDPDRTTKTTGSPTVQQPVRVSASLSGGAILHRTPMASASAPSTVRGIVSTVSAARSDVTGSRPTVAESREVPVGPRVTAGAPVRSPILEPASPPLFPDRAANAMPSKQIEPRPIRSSVVPTPRDEPMAAAQQASGWPSAAQPVAETPTTIHVTIGRIEVKATPPTKAQPRAAAAAASSSLDEYLRRRADRGDR